MNKVLFFSDTVEIFEPIVETCKSKNIFFIQRIYKNYDRISYGLFNVIICYFKEIDDKAIATVKEIRKLTQLPMGVITYTTHNKTIVNLHKIGIDNVFNANLINRGLADELTTFIYRFKYLLTMNDPQIVRIKNFTFDFNRYTAFFHNTSIHLTPKQFEVLLLLLSMDGHILTKDFIIKTLWPNHNPASDNALASIISRINKQFMEVADFKPIDTIHGLGYRLNTTLFD